MQQQAAELINGWFIQ